MSNRQKRGCVLVAVGLVLVMVSAVIHMMQENRDEIAGQNAKILLDYLEADKSSVVADSSQSMIPEKENTDSDAGSQINSPQKEETIDKNAMPEKEYLGYSMIGTVRIPTVGIELPVLSSWSYELLDVAPCRYSGSIAEGNLILMGHNYKRHFTPLHQIAVGDKVMFEDVNGIIYHYVVEEILYLHKTEGGSLSSDYPLTLFTCTPGGQNRIVVRCSKISDR